MILSIDVVFVAATTNRARTALALLAVVLVTIDATFVTAMVRRAALPQLQPLRQPHSTHQQ